MAQNSLSPNPMSETEIQRRHILYQKSYTGNELVYPRSVSPIRRKTTKRSTLRKQESPGEFKKVSPKQSRDISPQRRVFKSGEEELEFRRQSRAERTRPWQEKGPKVKQRNSKSVFFYTKILPINVGENNITVKPRRYVSNSKYGDIYELRLQTPKKEEKTPERKWLWEDEFLLWQKGSRDKYLEDVGNKTKTRLTSTKSGPNTLRRHNLPSIKEHPSRPNAEVYAYIDTEKVIRCSKVNVQLVIGSTKTTNRHTYNNYRLKKTAKKSAALKLQTVFRGWQVRSLLKKLKRKALLEHGRSWLCFVADYRELITRIRSRYGIMKPTCPIDLKQVQEFMDTKLRYESVFKQITENGKLPKEKLMEYFNRCDLWPTQRDINRGFDTVFRGSRNTAEVVFLLDCSSSVGVIGFYNLMKLVRNIVSCLDIAPDRTRVGVVPFNEDIFSSFGISTFTEKSDILAAISLIKLRHGLTRTDLALRLAREMFKDSRPGVQKIAIIITDGISTDPAKTAKEGKLLHDMGAKVFAIGVGEKANKEELELLATSRDTCYYALDLKSLSHIRRQIEQRLCLYMSTSHQPFRPSECDHVCRAIDQSEAMDILWTVYPPDACALHRFKKSRWIRPVIKGREAWSLLDDDIMRATGMRACLRLVVKSKLERDGFINIPSNVKEGVEKATSETQVLDIIDKYIRNQKRFAV